MGEDKSGGLIRCPKCKHRVSKAARTCPDCGHPIGVVGWLTESKLLLLISGIAGFMGINGLWFYDILFPKEQDKSEHKQEKKIHHQVSKNELPSEIKPTGKTVSEPISKHEPVSDKPKEDTKIYPNSEKSKSVSHKCPKCNGRPYYPCKKCNNGKIECPKCLGKGIEPCHRCSGRGEIWRGGSYEKCDACNGKGGQKCSQCKGLKTIPCPECNGTRRIHYTCPLCKGTGYINENK